MLRRLFTAASTVSLLLCLGAVVLWVRSYQSADSLILGGRLPGDDLAIVVSFDGRLFALRGTITSGTPSGRVER